MINQQHNGALVPASKAVISLLAGNDKDALRPDMVTAGEAMGDYEDII